MNEGLQEHVALVRELEHLCAIKEPNPSERLARENVMKQLYQELPRLNRPLLGRCLGAACQIDFPKPTEQNFRFQVMREREQRFMSRDVSRIQIPGPAGTAAQPTVKR